MTTRKALASVECTLGLPGRNPYARYAVLLNVGEDCLRLCGSDIATKDMLVNCMDQPNSLELRKPDSRHQSHKALDLYPVAIL